MIARLLVIFSVISLLIAAIGQYAVIAFNMRRRVREFGVRIALGASSRQVLTTVPGKALVTPTDPQTYADVFLLLGVVALLARCLPALAATWVDPVQALRQE
jgi:hypothetical protein